MTETEDIPAEQKIAIVGIGCRFAEGIDTVEKLWKVLEEGRDCTSPHPESRYDVSYFLSPGEKLPGKMYSMRGGFIKQDPYSFDRNFFKMSPDEAKHLDPNVRLLLEVTSEALEDSGIPLSTVSGSQTGVYIGGMNTSEFRSLVSLPDYNIGQYTSTGNASCMMSNRLSYEFDLRGPSLSLDTACSSSLYAIFLACEALKSNQCPIAIAGGINMMLLPFGTIALCQAGMVSPDGRSKSFDQSADGYGRGEGVGVFVLKTLKDALNDKDRVYAVIRGGALCNDGRTAGITSPSPDAQMKLLKSACLHAKVAPRDITYTEAHGTGTALGDKTEVSVLGRFLGQSRLPEQPPLYLGSIKSNLGHTEGAAGIAGLIKAALCLKHQVIPRVVHFNAPNPSLDFDQLNLVVPQSTTPWPSGEPLIALCSSFGFGGSNACIILESAPTAPIPNQKAPLYSTIERKPTILLLSAATKEALHQRLRDWLTFLQNADIQSNDNTFRAALYTAAQRSHHHRYRIGFVVTTVDDAVELIRLKLTDGDVKARSAEGVARNFSTGRIVFVFSGMGTQWWGMARELMHKETVFASIIKRIAKYLKNCGAKWSLIEMLTKEDDFETINKTEIAQPIICAVQIGLVELWRTRDIIPDVVVGHSVGEVAAAYCAGLLTLEHAIGLIYHRGRQLQKTSDSGTMVAVLHPFSEVLERMKSKSYGKSLDIAALNSPYQVVISGDCISINDLIADCKTDNMRCVQLKVRNAFHSRQQDCLENTFKHKVSKFLRPHNSNDKVNYNKVIPMISTVTGRYLTREEANTSEYWWRNIRQQVLFKSVIESLYKDGFQVFVEIGSHPALTPAIEDTIANFHGASVKPITVGSLLRPRDISKPAEDRVNLLLNHVKLFVLGIPVNFASSFDVDIDTIVSLPKYPWQRELCSAVTPDAREEYQFPVKHHHLLGEEQVRYFDQTSLSFTKCWKSTLTKSSAPWLKDHLIGGVPIFPAAAYIEISLAAAMVLYPGLSSIELQNVSLQKFLHVPDGEGLLETTVKELTPERANISVKSREQTRDKWIQHMEADIVKQNPIVQRPEWNVESIKNRCSVSVTTEILLETKEYTGLTLGPSFKTITHVYVDDTFTEVLSYCEAPDVIFREFDQYIFHPALLDSCFQLFALRLAFKLNLKAKESGTLMQSLKQVPSQIQRLHMFKAAPRRIVLHLLAYDENSVSYCDVTVGDADTNEIIGEIQRLEFRKFEADIEVGLHVWSTNWLKVTSAERRVEGRKCLLFPDEAGLSTVVVKNLKASGVSTVIADSTANSKDKIKQYIYNASQPFTDILVLKSLDMVNVMNSSHSICEMTLEDFRNVQEEFPLFCLSLILGITDLSPDIWPRLMFFSVGAHAVIPGENVNPFMSHLHSIVMTSMYEEPKLHAVSIDLPLEADADEKISMISGAFLNLPDDENMVAYRKFDQEVGTSTSGCLVAPRLRFDSTSAFRIKTCNKSWMIIQDKGRAKLSLKTKATVHSPELFSKGISVNLQALHLNAVEDDSINASESDSHLPDQFVTIYAGVKQDNSSKKEHSKTASKKVLGICDFPLSSTITLPSENGLTSFAEIPDGFESSEAIELVTEYLPAQLYFHDIFPLVPFTQILFLTDNDIPAHFLSFPLLANANGAEITVVSLDNNFDDTKMKLIQQNGNSSIINIKDINSLENSTADLLIVPMASTALHKHTSIVVPKLKISGTVLYLFDGNIKQQTVIPSMSAIRFMTFSTSLPKVLRRQTPENLARAIEGIIYLLNQPKGLSKLSRKPNKNTLSTTPLVNGIVPNSTTITVDKEQTELPLDLHDEMWSADKDRSYLVTGGTSGFGFSLVKWLVSRGANHIFVISRRVPSEEAQRFFAEEKVARIHHYKADVSNVNQIEGVLTSIRDSTSPPLVGIFHLAAVYRDGFMYNTTSESWHSVLETKAYGALVLHQLTQKLKISLKHFVVSSSLVSMIGNAGQVNYCAANNFLNNLCQMRHYLGLPATCMCIGYINTVGYAASHNLIRAGEERGMISLSPKEVLKAFSVAMKTGMPQMGIGGPLAVGRFVQKNANFATHHFSKTEGKFSILKDLFAQYANVLGQTNRSFRQILLEKSEEEAKALITKTICKIMSAQLGIPDDIDTDASLVSLGLDSLMATSISEAIVYHFEVNISPVELINENTSIQMLQRRIFRQISEVSDGNITNNIIQDVRVTQKPWIVDGPNSDTSDVMMVCFPPSAGGISFFSSWTSHVVKYGIQLLMVQLPGWEGRELEKPLHSMDEILQNLTEALVPRLKHHRFVFFGHSIGSLMAFETALQLEKHDLRPIHIFLSSWYAPTLPYPYPEELKHVNDSSFRNLEKLFETDKYLTKHVMKQQGIAFKFLDEAFFDNPVLLLRMLPAIEAAFHIIKAYDFDNRVPLHCGMTVFGGKNDPFISPRLLYDWKRQVASRCYFKRIILEGNHMHILGNTEVILKEVGLILQRYTKT